LSHHHNVLLISVPAGRFSSSRFTFTTEQSFLGASDEPCSLPGFHLWRWSPRNRPTSNQLTYIV